MAAAAASPKRFRSLMRSDTADSTESQRESQEGRSDSTLIAIVDDSVIVTDDSPAAAAAHIGRRSSSSSSSSNSYWDVRRRQLLRQAQQGGEHGLVMCEAGCQGCHYSCNPWQTHCCSLCASAPLVEGTTEEDNVAARHTSRCERRLVFNDHSTINVTPSFPMVTTMHLPTGVCVGVDYVDSSSHNGSRAG